MYYSSHAITFASQHCPYCAQHQYTIPRSTYEQEISGCYPTMCTASGPHDIQDQNMSKTKDRQDQELLDFLQLNGFSLGEADTICTTNELKTKKSLYWLFDTNGEVKKEDIRRVTDNPGLAEKLIKFLNDNRGMLAVLYLQNRLEGISQTQREPERALDRQNMYHSSIQQKTQVEKALLNTGFTKAIAEEIIEQLHIENLNDLRNLTNYQIRSLQNPIKVWHKTDLEKLRDKL